MATSIINKLKQYSGYINEDDLFDFCIQIGVLDKHLYCKIHLKPEKNRLNELFNVIVDRGQKTIELVLIYLKKAVPHIDDLIRDDYNFRKSTVRGSLPKLPPNYIKRESFEWKKLANQIKQELENLEWNGKLVVHGMMGYGKSCLINEVLNDKNLRKYFDNNVFWVNLGEHNVNYLLQIMWRLYNSVCDSSNTTNKIHCPDDPLILKEKLKEIFLEYRLRNALLILDDVCKAEVLDLFDFGCRTVITTQSKDILKNESACFVEVNTGFSLEEAMNLFRLSLGTIQHLPLIAEQIFTVCKGHPMLIALIGSYLSENRSSSNNHQNEIWEYILTMFLKGDYRLNEYDEDITVPTAKIRKCVDKLLDRSEILKTRYKDLGIFLEDVNIPPEILEILWDTSESDVRNTMNKFAAKSLVVIFYNKNQQRFIYGVHSIHLNYLKEEMQSDIRNVHKKLIDGYDKLTNGNYALLPNDNYSFHFIAYHLFMAEKYHKFSIYLDLKFLEAKIKAVGKDDTLRDMVKYENYIVEKNPRKLEILLEFKDFIKKYGANLFNFPKVDIIQYALQENENSTIYRMAYSIAQYSKHLYFNFLEPLDDDLSEFDKIIVQDDITSACFVDSSKHILLGCRSGKIKLFFEVSEKEMCTFVNPNCSPIKSLIISKSKSHFLAISEDGIVNLWKFPADGRRNSFSQSGAIDSPKTKQKFWQNVFNNELIYQVKPERVFKPNDDSFIVANFHENYPLSNWIVTGSINGNCCIWSSDTGKKITETGRSSSSSGETSCVLLTSEYLMFSVNTAIYTYKIQKIERKYIVDYVSCFYAPETVKKFYLQSNELITINESSITVLNMSYNNVKNRLCYTLTGEAQNYECISLTNDSKYLIVSTSKNKICFWDTETRRTTRILKNKWLTRSMDTIYDEHNFVHILLIGTDNKCLLQCPVQAFNKDNLKINSFTSNIFQPYWKGVIPIIPLIPKSHNSIQLFHGYQFTNHIDVDTTVTSVCFSPCGKDIIYGLINGEIYVYYRRTQRSVKCKDFSGRGPIKFLKTIKVNNYNTASPNSEKYTIISLCQNNFIAIHTNDDYFGEYVDNPQLFFRKDNIILINNQCEISQLNLHVRSLFPLYGYAYPENSNLCAAAFCEHKDLLSIAYAQGSFYFLSFVSILNDVLLLQKKLAISNCPKSCCFTRDGSLLVVGYDNGVMGVYNLLENYTLTEIEAHENTIEQMLCYPGAEPILITLSEDEISWWNLKSLKKPDRRCLSIFQSDDDEDFNVGFWTSLETKDKYLLSCLKLNGKPTYVAPSYNFQSFLIAHENGKFYIIATI